MIVNKNIFGWHGFGEIKIEKQNENDIIVDISNWVNKNGEAEWKYGIMIKKEFTSTIVIVINPLWDKKLKQWECDNVLFAKGYQKGNKFYAKLYNYYNFDDHNELMAFFPHKAKSINNVLTPIDLSDNEIQLMIMEVNNATNAASSY